MTDLIFRTSRTGEARLRRRPAPVTEPVRGMAAGTLIDTPAGARPVETLCPGDRVDTLDHGPMTVRWVHVETQDFAGLGEAARPVLIQAGAFGPGCPARDLVVSAGHHVLLGALGQLDGLPCGQVLTPARSLTRLPRIRPMMGRRQIRWIHLLLDSHEVLRAEGCHCESLRLTPAIVGGLRAFRRKRLAEAFAHGSLPMGPAARDCLGASQLAAALAGRAAPERIARVA